MYIRVHTSVTVLSRNEVHKLEDLQANQSKGNPGRLLLSGHSPKHGRLCLASCFRRRASNSYQLLLIVVLPESSLELNEQFESIFNWQIFSLIISNHNMENGAVSPLSTIILSLFSSEVNVHLIQLIPSTWWLTIYSLSAHNLSSFRSPSPQTPPVLVVEESTSNVCAHLPNSAGPVSNTWDSTVHPKLRRFRWQHNFVKCSRIHALAISEKSVQGSLHHRAALKKHFCFLKVHQHLQAKSKHRCSFVGLLDRNC